MINRQSISLGRIFNIPIGLDYSWFLIFILLTWSLAISYFPAEFKNWPTIQYWVVGAITAIMLFVSVLLHELGHSVVALAYKIPVKSITLFIFGGVSQIGDEPPSALAEFWISIVGPLVSFALALILFIVQPLTSVFAPLLAVVKYLFIINLFLGLFNLIPGFPLDGGGVFMAIVWGLTNNVRRATIIAANVGRFIAYLFIIIGVYLVFTGNIINGIWIAFIGWFLESAAAGQVQQQKIQGLLAGHKVKEAMSRAYTSVMAESSLQGLVDDHILGQGRRSFLVERGDQVVGLLTLHNIKETPREQWTTTHASQVMISLDKLRIIQPETELWSAIKEMDRDGVNQLPVMVDGHIEGMLSREDVISYLRTLQELESR